MIYFNGILFNIKIRVVLCRLSRIKEKNSVPRSQCHKLRNPTT